MKVIDPEGKLYRGKVGNMVYYVMNGRTYARRAAEPSDREPTEKQRKVAERFRAVQRPGISVALTVISLGTRVLLAYALSALPGVGVTGIWWSVPIGWFLADAAGLIFYRLTRNTAKIG